jgi:regulator of RNase E activity RraA
LIVDGLVRDVAILRELRVPVLARGHIPVGPLKLPAEEKGIGRVDVDVRLGGVLVSPGDWVFADLDGVIVLPQESLSEVKEQADQTLIGEARLLVRMRKGEALGDLLGIEDFMARRDADPSVDFNEHLARQGDAI